MTRSAILLTLILVGACSEPGQSAVTVPQLDRDTMAYAAASCFSLQSEPFLKAQGERWAGAVIQRGHGDIEKWSPIAHAVAMELKRSGIRQGQGNDPQSATIPMPVMTCGEIVDVPTVKAAIAKARSVLAEDYAKVKR